MSHRQLFASGETIREQKDEIARLQAEIETSMGTSTSDIIALIQEAIPPASDRHRPWWMRVAPEHLETVAAIHAAWHDGLFGTRKMTAARVISRRLRDLGIDIGNQGVMAWLLLPRS